METQPKRAKSSIKRLMRDLRYLNDNPIENLYIHYEESNLNKIYVMIIGKKDTNYAFGYYFFELTIPQNYPMEAPNMICLNKNGDTKIHKFIFPNGSICFSLLSSYSTTFKHTDTATGWTPIMSIYTLLLSFQEFFFNDGKTDNYKNVYEYAIKSVIQKTNAQLCLDYFWPIITKTYKENIEFIKKKTQENGIDMVDLVVS